MIKTMLGQLGSGLVAVCDQARLLSRRRAKMGSIFILAMNK
jgi:hypothetical protein